MHFVVHLNLFNHFDANQDGFLDEKEFKELSQFFVEPNDKDNTINREITNQFGFLSDWELSEDFNTIDEDNDGKISYQGWFFFLLQLFNSSSFIYLLIF